MELTVLGFLAPTLVTYLCWWHKPRDVMTAQTIYVDTSVEDVFSRAGLPVSTEWYKSPLDFIERSEHHGSILFRYWINILARVKRPIGNENIKYISVEQRRSDNDIQNMETKWGFLEVIPTIPYLAINFAAWNSHLPTNAELWMWRAASIAMAATFMMGALIEGAMLYLLPHQHERDLLQRYRDEVSQPPTHRGDQRNEYTTFTIRVRKLVQRLRNNSAVDDPNLDVPLRLLIPATLFAAIYLISRLYVLIEDVISFRSMPGSVYAAVQWSDYFPHIS
ncbi:uncharacterized protein AB675_2827 [Cyphellophora attinorum]|uniref:Uncharacterized protein n=1 Tax=Cyphellophora attinorum TaxID=1664694 RepID=A0A0N1HAQ1_9EURO|nr:uncharacterized protein AB675_2827 [Phialophora attinorum]KPI45106.1 hypothetical protein AB675_2827 [Phialophora attinorum]